MNSKTTSIAVDMLVATVTGIVAVVTVLPFSLMALAACLIMIAKRRRARLRQGQEGFAFAEATVALLVFGGAALYRPAKVVTRLLQREVALPATSMTLAKLERLPWAEAGVLPTFVEFSFAEEDRETRVEWPRGQMTFGEFVEAIEAQSPLRRRFVHCGNGYTVLGGGDCSFGLSLRDPELSYLPD